VWVQVFSQAEQAAIEARSDAVVATAGLGALPPEAVCRTFGKAGNLRRTKFFFGEFHETTVDILHTTRLCFSSAAGLEKQFIYTAAHPSQMEQHHDDAAKSVDVSVCSITCSAALTAGARYLWMREQLEAAGAHRAEGVRTDVPPVPPWVQVAAVHLYSKRRLTFEPTP
jgi:hypothetical protein